MFALALYLTFRPHFDNVDLLHFLHTWDWMWKFHFQQIFQPPVPSDVAMSFYVHGSKLVLAVYHLHTNGQHRLDISHRMQVGFTAFRISFLIALKHQIHWRMGYFDILSLTSSHIKVSDSISHPDCLIWEWRCHCSCSLKMICCWRMCGGFGHVAGFTTCCFLVYVWIQMEVVVQWLNEAIICFTLALQQCQQLFDKVSLEFI